MTPYIAETNIPLQISRCAANKSVLITGDSGSGKTVAMRKMARERSRKGQKVLVFNYGGTHEEILADRKNYNVIKAREEGVPIPFLECFSSPYGGSEEDADVCEAVAEVFSQINRMGYVAQSYFEEACQRAIQMRETCDDDMRCLYKAVLLLEEGNKILIPKYRNLLTRIKFHKNFDLWREGKVTVLDFSGYPYQTQLFLTQLILSVIWRYYRIFGQQMEGETTLVLDEFQNLPLREGAVLTQILREGRKFHLSLLLATQTLFTFDAAKRIILQQPATKIYFRPVEEELKRISKHFPDLKPADAERLLQGLGIGECLANGVFDVAGSARYRTLKVSFWED